MEQGQTLYAKGIDQYENETRIISSYIANVSDALRPEAYDGNDSTYVSEVTNQYMQIDPSMQEKSITVKFKASCLSSIYTHDTATVEILFLDSNKQLIQKVTRISCATNEVLVVPKNSVYLVYTGTRSVSYFSTNIYYPYLYEIQP